MVGFAAIVLKRSAVQAAYSTIPLKYRNSADPLDAMLRENSKMKTFKFSQIDREMGQRTISKAVDWLADTSNKKIEYLCVAGYGPFVSLDKSAIELEKNAYGLVGDIAHLPFADTAPVQIAKEFFRQNHGIDLPWDNASAILDVEAFALGNFWAGYRTEGMEQTVAAVCIGRGVNGAITRKFRVRQNFHPEMGHIPVHRVEADKPKDEKQGFKSACEEHDRCLQGFANMTALLKRAENHKISFEDLRNQPDHPIWEIEAEYIAGFLVKIALMGGASRIVLGGSIIELAPETLIERIRKHFTLILKHYVLHPGDIGLENFIMLGNRKSDSLAGCMHYSIRKWSQNRFQ